MKSKKRMTLTFNKIMFELRSMERRHLKRIERKGQDGPEDSQDYYTFGSRRWLVSGHDHSHSLLVPCQPVIEPVPCRQRSRTHDYGCWPGFILCARVVFAVEQRSED